jgi:phage baseplate assembly protein W
MVFEPHPVTGDILKKSGPAAVVQSLKNLILLNYYEKPFHPEIGSNIRKLLFELVSPTIAALISKEIEIAIQNFEPRVELRQIQVVENFNGDGFDVTIEFFIVNIPDPITVSFFLERLR